MHQLSTVHFTGVVVPPVISLQCIHRCRGPSSHLTAVHSPVSWSLQSSHCSAFTGVMVPPVISLQCIYVTNRVNRPLTNHDCCCTKNLMELVM